MMAPIHAERFRYLETQTGDDDCSAAALATLFRLRGLDVRREHIERALASQSISPGRNLARLSELELAASAFSSDGRPCRAESARPTLSALHERVLQMPLIVRTC